MYDNIALILAGGSGSRFGADIPKQFVAVYGKPVIAYTLETFNAHNEIDAIFVVAAEGYVTRMEEITAKYGFDKVKGIIGGGTDRQQSSYFGLRHIKSVAHKDSVVLIHDAARALVSHEIIAENIRSARESGAVTTAVPSSDTVLKSADGAVVSEILDREGLFLIQTPQSFLFNRIWTAHEKAVANDKKYTDDSGLYMENSNSEAVIARGDRLNFKITLMEDIDIFKAIIHNKISV